MILFARIKDNTGICDGLQGTVVALWEHESRETLEAEVGPDVMWQFIEAPNDRCHGWRYEDGKFIEPDA